MLTSNVATPVANLGAFSGPRLESEGGGQIAEAATLAWCRRQFPQSVSVEGTPLTSASRLTHRISRSAWRAGRRSPEKYRPRQKPNRAHMRWGGWRRRMRADVRAVRLEGGVLAELYAQHASDALRLAYLLTGDAALAEDL